MISWASTSAEPRLRRELERWLSARFHSDVTVGTLSVQLFPIRVQGAGLELRLTGRPDLPPFVTIRAWSGSGGLAALRVRRLDAVTLEGVEVIVPPGRSADLTSLRGPGTKVADADGVAAPKAPLIIQRVVADSVLLTVMPRDASRSPTVWDVRDLVMEPFSLDAATPFHATVDTPLPNDRATVSGSVGPWPRDDFHRLPLSGTYDFAGDLAAVRGLEGQLRASGQVVGTLEQLAAHGVASSGRVALRAPSGGHVAFEADYDLVLDGTSGDLEVTRLSATLGTSLFDASGRLSRTRGRPGRDIALTVTAGRQADVSDVLRLIVDAERPPMTGPLTLEATLSLPSGAADVFDRLVVDGTLELDPMRFMNAAAQSAVDDLSRKGRGRPTDLGLRDVDSRLSGQVRLAHRQLSLHGVTFSAPGVTVAAAGTYDLDSEVLAFHGVARLDASVSKTQTGARRWLLRPLDPLWRRRGAGSRVVPDVRGTRRAPVIDIDHGRSLRGRP